MFVKFVNENERMDTTSELKETSFDLIVTISGFPNLNVMNRILLLLAVTSCSAGRTMSELKVVKNRLNNSTGDSWLFKYFDFSF